MAQPTNPDTAHRCLNGTRCTNKLDGDPRQTEKPHTFCDSCLNRTRKRINQIPDQYTKLHHMIGDRHAGIEVQIHRPQPASTVPLNIHIDTLLGNIAHTITLAAEVLADEMHMDDPTDPTPKDPNKRPKAPPWAESPKMETHEQIRKCCRIVGPNVALLLDLVDIDTLEWLPGGTYYTQAVTTGVELIKQLDHLGSLAYFTLGQTRARTRRDLPCARCRATTVGRWAGSEWFNCETCGSQFPEDELRRQDKILLELIKRGLIGA
jgi:hypothetical protein